jgi:ElaB/YqjD/DUF883 family membrane-anchored ribosome-binding protein
MRQAMGFDRAVRYPMGAPKARSTQLTEPTMIDTTKNADTLRDKGAEAKDNIADRGRLAKEGTQDKLHDLADRASETYDAGKEKLRAFGTNVGDKVKEYPIKALLIAAGAGLLLGMVARRS